MYERPGTAPVELTAAPRLASWDAATHPARLALCEYLDRTMDDIRRQLDAPPPWALELSVGLPPSVALLDHYDLDNYLFPLAERLGGTNLLSVRATKAHDRPSTLRLDTARPAPAPTPPGVHRVRTSASVEKPAFKQQIRDQLLSSGARAVVAPAGIALTVGFRCGPRRNWVNLWKPTIDALGPLLGEGPRPWHPADGAITELALHCALDESVGWEVEIAIDARPSFTSNLSDIHS